MIRTERLILRRARPDDLADLHAVMRRPEAMAYWSTPPHMDMATTKLWLDRKLSEDEATSVEFVVQFQGRAIGTAGGGTLYLCAQEACVKVLAIGATWSMPSILVAAETLNREHRDRYGRRSDETKLHCCLCCQRSCHCQCIGGLVSLKCNKCCSAENSISSAFNFNPCSNQCALQCTDRIATVATDGK
jgi:hypothetical protein